MAKLYRNYAYRNGEWATASTGRNKLQRLVAFLVDDGWPSHLARLVILGGLAGVLATVIRAIML